MAGKRRGWVWGGRAIAAVVIAGLVAYLCVVGLDKADKIASALGGLGAMAALAAPYLLPNSQRLDSDKRPAQVVTGTVVGGNLTQVQNVRASRVHNAPEVPPTSSPPLSSPVLDSRGGQYVDGVWVGGNLTQASGTDDDAAIG